MSCYSALLADSPEYRSVLQAVKTKKFPFGCLGLPPTPKALLIHSLCEQFSRGAFVITPDEAAANKLIADLQTLGSRACLYPARDFNFQTAQSSSKEYEQKRIGALAMALTGETDIVVASAEAVLQRTIPPEELKGRIFRLSSGQEISVDELRRRLVKCGYSASEMVEGPGQFSLRGGILDLFPADRENPVRIEFWGDEIDTIAEFDVISQRRADNLKEIDVSPVSEILFDDPEETANRLEALAKSTRGKNSPKVREALNSDASLLRAGISPGCCDRYLPVAYPEKAALLDYCGDRFLFVCETGGVRERALNAEKLLNEELRELFLDGVLCKGLDDFSITAGELMDGYTVHDTVFFDNFARGSFDVPVRDLVTFLINQLSPWDGSYQILL